jgi:large subunit ribosomal protein L3e
MSKYATKWANGAKEIEADLARITKYCSVVRVIAHTQIKKVTGVHQKKAHVMEIQLNGGSVSDKVAWAKEHFEKSVSVEDVFKPSEMIDTIGITRGHGFEGVITRWGVTRLPRKTHKGLRKVACIGSWHPARIRFTVARAGQHGYHHRTHINSKIYRIGKKDDPSSCTTDVDLTKKGINPMGGFPHYGLIKEDWLMVKGAVQGPKKRVVTLRKSLGHQRSRVALEQITLKFIDTSSKLGHGRFQTSEEKDKWMGPTLRRERASENIAVNKGAASSAMEE